MAETMEPPVAPPAAALPNPVITTGYLDNIEAGLHSLQTQPPPRAQGLPPVNEPPAVTPTTPAAPAKPAGDPSKLPDLDSVIEQPPSATAKEPEIEEFELPKNISQKASENFKRLKNERNEYKQRLQKLEQEREAIVKAQQQPPQTSEELAQLQKQVETYRSQLSAIAVERDPAFQQHFEQKYGLVFASIKNSAGEDADKVINAIKTGNNVAIEEALSVMPEFKKLRVGAALQRLEEIHIERQTAIANSAQNWQKLQSDHQAKLKGQQQQHEQLFSSEHDNWNSKHPLFQEREGDQAWNTSVQETRAMAKHIYSGQMEPKELAKAAHWAAAGVRLWGMNKELAGEVVKLQKQVEELRSVQPGTTTATARQGGPAVAPSASYGDAIEASLRGLGLR